MNTINNCLCYNPRGCKADALGGHPRQFSGLSDYSQLLVAGGDISFSGQIPVPSFFFSLCFYFVFCVWAFFCAHPKWSHHSNSDSHSSYDTYSYRNHSKTACNRPCTEQQSAHNSTFLSTRQRRVPQRKQADKNKCCREPPSTYTSTLFFLFPMCCSSNNAG